MDIGEKLHPVYLLSCQSIEKVLQGPWVVVPVSAPADTKIVDPRVRLQIELLTPAGLPMGQCLFSITSRNDTTCFLPERFTLAGGVLFYDGARICVASGIQNLLIAEA